MRKIQKCLSLLFAVLLATMGMAFNPVYATEGLQYWTESKTRVGMVEKVMNDGSITSTFNEGYLTVGGEDAYCIDINTNFRSGYKVREDASTRMRPEQISDIALSIEYVKQYTKSHGGISENHAYLLRQLVVWQRLSTYLGWNCDNVRASYNEIDKNIQDEVFIGAKKFVKENRERYECRGYVYSGEGQDLGQFWAKLNVGKVTLQKKSGNSDVTYGNGNYSLANAKYGVFSDEDCSNQVATLTTNEKGETEIIEMKIGIAYIKELSAPPGYKIDPAVHPIKIETDKTVILKVSDMPKVTDCSVEIFKIDMETQVSNPQGNALLEGAEFTWKYYEGIYNKENLPKEATCTWVTKTVSEKKSDGTIRYITKLSDEHKVSGDRFYMQDGKIVLPIGTLTVEETKAPNGYLLKGSYIQVGNSGEQIKGLYVAQIMEEGDFAVLTGSNQAVVSDKVIRGGVKIQKRDLETGDTKPQGGAALKYASFNIISLNENSVLVLGKLYKKNEVVKTIHTDINGIASTSPDLLPHGKYKLSEKTPPEGYLTNGAKEIEFSITEDEKMVDLTDKDHSIYNQVKRGDIEGVKIGEKMHKRLANIPFKITSKSTGESHIVLTDRNGQFSTSSKWNSHKNHTNEGKSSEDGIWFGISEPDDSKGALPYDTYTIEEMRCKNNQAFELIPAFEVVVSKDNHTVHLGTLTDAYKEEVSIHTTATGKNGEKTMFADKKAIIVDTVKLKGLKEGIKYQLKGWQMVKEDHKELVVNEKRVETTKEFIAKDAGSKKTMYFEFDSSELSGKSLVTFEELYEQKENGEWIKVAEHKDLNSEEQTILVKERGKTQSKKITIRTVSTGENGEKELDSKKELILKDKVELDGLEKGKTYKLKGFQMIKEDNVELKVNQRLVQSEKEFIAEDTKEIHNMKFTFDASELLGKNLVAFEEFYEKDEDGSWKKVAEHKDINDKNQTVHIKEKPQTPKKENPTQKEDKPRENIKKGSIPKTGESSNMYFYVGILCLSLAGMIAYGLYKRK
ncbi:VaFE repeat-containing surface-anchored protein [Streptococcus anginosus]|uniref:LPXTG-motif cell wall anchor domain protein n=1 Tax=Streptococcus anginosus subsp. whileyi CCUG 39159 TaxID=1095729 RepID=I0SJM3_STRAP|nr:LPXTG-motif cell wall anchor domain protein [Streptococcus anginosus subsp. whileyi CCUG 39159]QQT08551.1 VaFE repeat-containing surface-anchored protein [Streptococcus anginosus]